MNKISKEEIKKLAFRVRIKLNEKETNILFNEINNLIIPKLNWMEENFKKELKILKPMRNIEINHTVQLFEDSIKNEEISKETFSPTYINFFKPLKHRIDNSSKDNLFLITKRIKNTNTN